ncbi:MAG: glycosyltransferase family 4 protein [Bacteroidales bacterium]|nr:glycosyltransferase family 4 protein [Bacteroidales bacterium]
MKKVCLITSVHPRYDIRIFHKECKSLAGFYEVSLIVADGNGDEINESINIYDVGKSTGGRIKRILNTPKKILKKALELNADVYHFHDPELIPVGLKLKRKGKIVIYDVHEDAPKHVFSKDYIPALFKPIFYFILKSIEAYSSRKFDFVITVTKSINERFKKNNFNSIIINNYPIVSELYSNSEWKIKQNQIIYAGSISRIRGIIEVIKALDLTGSCLNLAGLFDGNGLLEIAKKEMGWEKVNYLGLIDRTELKRIMEKSKIGIVTYHNAPNHVNAQPNKIFEYMSAGIPVIASNFPLWKEIIEGNNCGICVDPLNSKEIADAVNYLLSNDKIAEEMGKNGRNAVIEKYNWNIEEKKLIEIYNKIRTT